jgi:hypothetical protein
MWGSAIRAVVSIALLHATGAVPALAQFGAPVLPPLPNMQMPRGCLPGQFCGNTPQFGFRCQTPQFWCGLPQPGPIGISCYCNSPYGPINGFVQQ